MALSEVQNNILDPGMGLAEPGGAEFTYMGTCSAGTANFMYTFSTPQAAQATLGEGPLAEAVCHHLATEGGSVNAVRLTGSVAGAAGSVTKVGAGGGSTGTITVAGEAYDAYQVTVEVITSGALGVAEFRYRLDKSDTDLSGGSWSEVLLVPSGGSYAIPRTNLTITFVPGAGPVVFEDGDVHTFSCTAPFYGTTDVANGFAALNGLPRNGVIKLCGEAADTADGATIFASLSTQMAALETGKQYFYALMNAGNDTPANYKSDFAAAFSSRITVLYGNVNMPSAKPFPGWGVPSMPLVTRGGARLVHDGATVSDDPERYATGPEEGVTAVEHDERTASVALNNSPDKAVVLRTYPGETVYRFAHFWVKSAPGSDYRYAQHRRVMDLACATTYAALLPYLSASFRILKDGTGRIDPRDKKDIEAEVQDALDSALVRVRNLDGRPHVSAVGFRVDGEHNILADEELPCTTALVPLVYPKLIKNTIGYAVSLGGA